MSIVVATSFAVCIGSASAETVVLYDAEQGTTPDGQGWAYVTRPLLIAKAKRSFANGRTRLDTTPVMGEWAGFLSRVEVRNIRLSHPRMPKLDREVGYTVRFQVRVVEEKHTGNNRAGFSIVVVGDDLQTVELAFWTREIWAQSGPNARNPQERLFTHSVERQAFDATADTHYALRVAGGSYTLWAGEQPVVSGPLRDYSSHWHPVYGQANTLFLGDNTSRAAAVVDLGLVAVTTDPAPDEPQADPAR